MMGKGRMKYGVEEEVQVDNNISTRGEAPRGDLPDADDAAIRILGLYEAKMTLKNGKLSGKLGELYNAIGRRFNLVGTASTRLTQAQSAVSLLRHFSPKRSEWLSRVQVQPLSFKMRTQNAERILKEWDGKYDLIVQLHTLFSAGFDLNKRPYILVTDNTYANTVRYWPQWAPVSGAKQREESIELEKEVYNHAQFCFTWSEFTRQSFINDYGVPPDRVIAVGGGANFIAPDLSQKPYDTQTAVFVGYEFERKGGYYLLEAWKQVNQQLPDAKLYIIGPYEPLADPIPGVHWLGRIDNRDELRRRLTESTLFVMPSLFEPYGHAFTEAMGMGLPVVAANHCAMPEIVHHNESGLLVPPRDAQSLAETLVMLLSDPRRASELGHGAYQQIQQAGTWDDVITRMAPYIRRAVQGKS
jgi:alpha-maltose-1-phosphate synthase